MHFSESASLAWDYSLDMEKKPLFRDNVGEKRTETSSEVEYRKERHEMFAQMSAADVAEAPFVYLDRQLVTLILTRIHLFEKILNVHGSIVECGVHRGNSLMLYQHLSTILEPTNFNRKIIGFDTFEGFPSVTKHDSGGEGVVGHMQNTEYKHLARWVALQDKNRTIGHIPKIELVKGDAIKTIPQYVLDNPYLIIAFLYMDFDIYEPTAVALKHLLPLVPKGGVVGFDEACQKRWQGETVALKENISLSGVRLQRFYYDPYVSYYVVD